MNASPPLNPASLVAEIRAGLELSAVGILLLAGCIGVTDFVGTSTLLLELAELLLLFGCAWGIAAHGLPRTAMLIGAFALFVGLSGTTALLSMVLAASALPYADAMLASADARLFGDGLAPGLIRTGRAYPGLLGYLSIIYDCLNIQPLLLILCLSYRGDIARLARFLNAWGIALALCLLIFPFVPAVGFYLHHAVPFESTQGLTVPAAWAHLDILAALRSGALRTIDGQTFAGIVTFPSFHAAAAFLLTWGFKSLRLLRWPVLLLNMAMLLSAIFVGGHYIVDLIGGALVALLAVHLSGKIAIRPASPRSTRPLFHPTPNRL